MKAQQVRTIAGFEFYRIMRSPAGILFFAFFFVFYAWVCSKLYDIGPDLNDIVSKNIDLNNPNTNPAKMIGIMAMYEIVAWLTGLTSAELDTMTHAFPPLLVLFSFLAMVATPILSMFGSMDQTASDISSRHIRFLLMRTDRTSLYIGKTLGAWLVLIASVTLIVVISAVMALASGSDFGSVAMFSLRFWLVMVIFSLPFVTLMGFANALTAQPFLALLVGIGYYFVVWSVGAIASWSMPKLKFVGYLFPTAMKYQLLSTDLSAVGLALLHQSVIAAFFLVCGLAFFRWRDV